MIGKETKFFVLIGILILSIIVAVNLLLVSSPLVIQLEGDNFKVIEIPYAYTKKEAYILLFTGLVAGLSISQLLSISDYKRSSKRYAKRGGLNSDFDVDNALETNPALKVDPDLKMNTAFKMDSCLKANHLEGSGDQLRQDRIDLLLNVLEGDELKTVEIIVENGGRVLQNELVNSLNYSKAKVSRILMKLEQRGIVKKEKYGLTNRISLSGNIRGEKR